MYIATTLVESGPTFRIWVDVLICHLSSTELCYCFDVFQVHFSAYGLFDKNPDPSRIE